MIAYHGGKPPSSKEEGMQHMNNWKNWIQGLGDKVINPGTPLAQSMLITQSDVTNDTEATHMKGFAVIEAENVEQAIEMAKSDPFLNMGGTIRLSEMKQMP